MTSTRIRRAIVVGVDGSYPAQLALRWALTEAALRRCPVHVLHAWSVGPAGDFVWVSRRDLHSDSKALLRTALAAACEHVDATVEVTCRSVEGRPGPVLVDAARGNHLLVLGSHRARWVSSGLGSAGPYCAWHATVPVAVIPQTMEPGDRSVAG